MDFNQEQLTNNSIVSYNNSSINLQLKTLNIPCFVSNKTAKSIDFSIINAQNISQLLNCEDIELLIIGSNKNIDIKSQIALNSIINCEFVKPQSAIGIFNLSLADNRNVGIILQ